MSCQKCGMPLDEQSSSEIPGICKYCAEGTTDEQMYDAKLLEDKKEEKEEKEERE